MLHQLSASSGAAARRIADRYRWPVVAVAIVSLLGAANGAAGFAHVSAQPLGQTIPLVSPPPPPPPPPAGLSPEATATPAPVSTPSAVPTGIAPVPTGGALIIAGGAGVSRGDVTAAGGTGIIQAVVIAPTPSATPGGPLPPEATPTPGVILRVAPTPIPAGFATPTPPPAGATPAPRAPGATPVVVAAYDVDVHKYDPATNSVGEKVTDTQVQLTLPVDQDTYTMLSWVFGTLPGNGLNVTGSNQQIALLRPKADGTFETILATYIPSPPGLGYLQTNVFTPASLYLIAVVPRSVPADERYFKETGFRVNNDYFWDYFNKRGGVRTFGYPISREFTLQGFVVQFFQRGVLQAMPNGEVARLNLLDAGFLPYTQINFSTFPAPDQALIQAAPSPSDPDYGEKAIAFVNANVPDEWNGMKVSFLSTFNGTVRYEDAFPTGGGNDALLPLFDLEIWGLPTSKPMADPNNGSFVYQRFQRGIMHYDASTGATQGLLLADYLKSIITGQNLPSDLESEAKGSKFYRQLDPSKPAGVARPQDLPRTSLATAFEKEIVK